jgi:hypothetical protein
VSKFESTASDIYEFLSENTSERNFKKLIFFMFQVINTFIDRSPEMSRNYFGIARQYWFDEIISVDAFLEYKKEIRKYISSVNGTYEWNDASICNIKSVLCLFSIYKSEHPDAMADIFDTFLDLTEKWIDRSKLLEIMNNNFREFI